MPLRLPRPSPSPAPPPPGEGPVVLFLPAHDEAEALPAVLTRVPAEVCGREVRCIVVDDGSQDDIALLATRAGVTVITHETCRGLGAAVRTGFEAAVLADAAVVAFCDADGEYAPEELERLVAPILDGVADYVVGSRFSGRIERMLRRRRLGNQALTHALAWITRAPITDGQSGYRALSRTAVEASAITHDFNYAQVLTIDLLAKGFRYAEVPISYRFRETGTSFVRLGSYLRHVVPAVARQLRDLPDQSSTTCPANTARDDAQRVESIDPSTSASAAARPIASA